MPVGHLFEGAVQAAELRDADARLAPLLTPAVLESAAAAVPDVFLLCSRAEYAVSRQFVDRYVSG